jgi:hypothetical protein
VGNTIGVEYVNGETTTPASISALANTFVSVESKVFPAKIGVAELAATVGSVLGKPGELLTCVTTRRPYRQARNT